MKTIFEKEVVLRELTRKVWDSPHSDFYRKVWKEDPVEIASLPLLERSDLEKTAFRDRLYGKESLFVRAALRQEHSILIGCSASELVHEEYGQATCARPYLLFGNHHDGMEAAFWLYGKNILPLVERIDPQIVRKLATLWEADALFGDCTSLLVMAETLQTQQELRRIIAVDSYFPIGKLRVSYSAQDISFCLRLPETGPFAFSCPSAKTDEMIFHPTETALLEFHKEELIISKLNRMSSPIIRYRSGIAAAKIVPTCSCNAELAFTLPSHD